MLISNKYTEDQLVIHKHQLTESHNRYIYRKMMTMIFNWRDWTWRYFRL